MKLNYDFRNGQRYVFIISENETDTQFLHDFASSTDKIEERFNSNPHYGNPELTLSKGMS